MIDFELILWDDPDKPRGNVQHVLANDVTPEEVEEALHDPQGWPTTSRSTGRPS